MPRYFSNSYVKLNEHDIDFKVFLFTRFITAVPLLNKEVLNTNTTLALQRTTQDFCLRNLVDRIIFVNLTALEYITALHCKTTIQ